jgi:hypothetical protein
MSVDYSSADIAAAVDAFHAGTTDWYVSPSSTRGSALPTFDRPATCLRLAPLTRPAICHEPDDASSARETSSS